MWVLPTEESRIIPGNRFILPIGMEVTNNSRYYNSGLVVHPYSIWGEL